jgi:hypothetical protein
MAKYAIGITTVNRYPKRNYLKPTLRNMQRGGVFDYPDVTVTVSDSGSQNGLLHIRDYTNEYQDIWHKVEFLEERDRICANDNVAKVLRHCANKTDQYVIYMQDDLDIRPKLMENIDKFVRKYPGELMWSFHAAYNEVLKRAKRREDKWRYPFKNYYGSLCYVLRKHQALEYADVLTENARRGTDIGGDIILSKWMRTKHGEKATLAASCPCYVQHIGVDSVLSVSHGVRTNQSFDEFFPKGVR